MKKSAEASGASASLKKFWNIFRTALKVLIIILIITACMAGGLLIGVVAACVTTTEPLNETNLSNSTLTSFLYYSDGSPITYTTEDGAEEIIKLKGSANVNRILVDIEDVPKYLTDAFVAIEDERFYTHRGVDIKRTAGAFVTYLVPGMRDYGGSTITQQLVKNATGDNAQSIPRKIREAWRAYLLEKDYTKDEILEHYINIIYMGKDIYGVQAASRAIFGKDVEQISLAEASFLAGITNNPSVYSPFTTKGRINAYKRQITILDKMLSLGMISKAEYIEAIQTKLVFNEEYVRSSSSGCYSYFVETVIKDVRSKLMELGYTQTETNKLIYGGGLSIMTTQDKNIQKILDREFTDIDNFPANSMYTAASDMAQAAAVVIDQYTGQVRAMYGGYGEKTTNFGFNYATDAQRQPGSSIKPILVYAPLLDQHVISTSTIVQDVPSYLDPSRPTVLWPKNSYNSYKGDLTIRQALAVSCNVAAVSLYKDHVSLGLSYLKKDGIDRTNETQLSVALGGLTKGVCVLDIAAAYVPFSNGTGVYYKPITFTKVLDNDGKVLIDNTVESTLVYEDPKTASTMTSLLQSVVDSAYNGTGKNAVFDNAEGQYVPIAGKTGTTTSSYDYWFVGYTGYYTTAVWYGYPKQTSMQSSEKGAAINIWRKVMEGIHWDLPVRSLSETAVSSGKAYKICAISHLLATDACAHAENGSTVYTEYFSDGNQPVAYCTAHQKYTICSASGTDENGKYYLACSDCPEDATEVIITTHSNISDLPCPHCKTPPETENPDDPENPAPNPKPEE